jgi:hypothetical protein
MKVKVKNAELGKLLKHPGMLAKVFDADGIADWPADQFTRRRIKDGDITAVDPADMDVPSAPAIAAPLLKKTNKSDSQ